MFKICLIGCGFMTRDGHGPSCKLYAETHPDTQLAACCDLSLEAAQNTCQQFGFARAYTDYIEMVETENPDVVLVITPVHITAKVSIELLRRGIPVILEKPPGVNIEENLAIHTAAMESNTPARVAFNRRYTPLVMALKEELQQVGLPVLDIDCLFMRKSRTDADFSTTAIHGIDTVSYLVGADYKSCHFHYTDIEYNAKPVTNILINAQMEDGASATLHFMPCSGCVIERITVTTVDHTFFLELPVWGGMDAPGKLVCTRKGEVYKTVLGDKYTLHESNGFYDESRLFFDSLRNDETLTSDVLSGCSSVTIADHIRHREATYHKK